VPRSGRAARAHLAVWRLYGWDAEAVFPPAGSGKHRRYGGVSAPDL